MTCPNCGYCKHCGRAWPTPSPWRPYAPVDPYWWTLQPSPPAQTWVTVTSADAATDAAKPVFTDGTWTSSTIQWDPKPASAYRPVERHGPTPVLSPDALEQPEPRTSAHTAAMFDGEAGRALEQIHRAIERVEARS